MTSVSHPRHWFCSSPAIREASSHEKDGGWSSHPELSLLSPLDKRSRISCQVAFKSMAFESTLKLASWFCRVATI